MCIYAVYRQYCDENIKPIMSRMDHLFRSLLLTKFFKKGWGKPEDLKRLVKKSL